MRKCWIVMLVCVALIGCGVAEPTGSQSTSEPNFPTAEPTPIVMADTVIRFAIVDDANGDGMAQADEPQIAQFNKYVDSLGARPFGESSLMWAGGALFPLTITLKLPADSDYHAFTPVITLTESMPITFTVSRYAGVLVESATYRGVIVDPAFGELFSSVNGDLYDASYWRPTPADIAQAEAELPAFLQTAAAERNPDLWQKIPTYARQYTGIEQNGRRSILINAMCDTYAQDNDWRSVMIFVLDGGDCFFNVMYYPDDGSFDHLLVNGDA